jgi:hypothetical protein
MNSSSQLVFYEIIWDVAAYQYVKKCTYDVDGKSYGVTRSVREDIYELVAMPAVKRKKAVLKRKKYLIY